MRIRLTPAVFKTDRDARNLFAFGRMKPGLTREAITKELNVVAARLAQQYPATNDGWEADVRALREAFIPDDVSLVLYLMMAGVTLVLFIACSNVATPPWRRRWSRDGSASIVVTDRDDRCRQGPQHEVAAGGGGQGQVECFPRLSGAVVEDGDRHRLAGLPVGERQHLRHARCSRCQPGPNRRPCERAPSPCRCCRRFVSP